MILAPGELRASLTGAWRIARMDPQAMQHFNLTVEGFWASFRIAVATIPLHLLTLYMRRQAASDGAEPENALSFLLAYTLLSLIHLVLFPLAMVLFTIWLKLQDRLVAFIIAWNWASVLFLGLLVPEAILAWFGILPDGLIGLIELLMLAAVIMYAVLVARAGLECAILTALGIAVVEQVLALGVAFFFRPWL